MVTDRLSGLLPDAANANASSEFAIKPAKVYHVVRPFSPSISTTRASGATQFVSSIARLTSVRALFDQFSAGPLPSKVRRIAWHIS